MYNINSGAIRPPGPVIPAEDGFAAAPYAHAPYVSPHYAERELAPPPDVAWQPHRRLSLRLILRLAKWTLMITVWGGLAIALLMLWFTWDMPRPSSGIATLRRPSLVLTDEYGRTFTHFGDLSGSILTLRTVPATLPEAVVAVEDRRFWQHGALDIVGMARATVVDLVSGRIVQGGSTLTQQVAKTLFLSNARTFRRKVQELLLTLWLTHHFTPAEILEIYLNRVYLGAGAWGMDAAAETYFGLPARDLNLWQSAMLAGLPRAPSRFNPLADPEAATARTREVLAAMVRSGYITQPQSDAAAAAISFAPRVVGGDTGSPPGPRSRPVR
jgi:penicillin-binding protein 1A